MGGTTNIAGVATIANTTDLVVGSDPGAFHVAEAPLSRSSSTSPEPPPSRRTHRSHADAEQQRPHLRRTHRGRWRWRCQNLNVGMDANMGGAVTIGSTADSTTLAPARSSCPAAWGHQEPQRGRPDQARQQLSVSGVTTITSTQVSGDTSNGALVVAGGVGVGGDLQCRGPPESSEAFSSTSTQNATSSSTGALITDGGLGVAMDAYIGGAASINAASRPWPALLNRWSWLWRPRGRRRRGHRRRNLRRRKRNSLWNARANRRSDPPERNHDHRKHQRYQCRPGGALTVAGGPPWLWTPTSEAPHQCSRRHIPEQLDDCDRHNQRLWHSDGCAGYLRWRVHPEGPRGRWHHQAHQHR